MGVTPRPEENGRPATPTFDPILQALATSVPPPNTIYCLRSPCPDIEITSVPADHVLLDTFHNPPPPVIGPVARKKLLTHEESLQLRLHVD